MGKHKTEPYEMHAAMMELSEYHEGLQHTVLPELILSHW
jgi:hypothetical protein